MEKTGTNPNPTTTITFGNTNTKLGQIKFGESKEFTFEFTNTGKEEFVVKNIGGSCSCTEIIDYKKRVAPGQKGFVKIKFDSNKASVQNAYPSGVEIFANTPDPLTLFNFTIDVVK